MDRRVPKGTKAIPVRKANADYKASGVRRESAVHTVSGVLKASEVRKDPQEQKGIKVIQVRKDRRERSCTGLITIFNCRRWIVYGQR